MIQSSQVLLDRLISNDVNLGDRFAHRIDLIGFALSDDQCMQLSIQILQVFLQIV